MRFTATAISLLIACNLAISPASTQAADFPAKPIRVVVSFAAGGGSDILVRTLAKSIEVNKLLPVPLVVLNVDGAGGSIGARQVRSAAPDGYTLLASHFALISAGATGVADFGVEAFEPVAQIASSCLVWAVRDDSPYRSLKELMAAAKDKPNTISEAINIGAVVHITSWITTDAAGGARMRYVQSGGGAKRFEALYGKHVDVAQFSTAEYAAFRAKGLRALALLSDKRHPDFPDLPTAREQGIDAIGCVSDWIFAPKGTPREAIATVATAIEKALKDPEVLAFFKRDSRDITFMTGPELNASIARDAALINTVVMRHKEELSALKGK